MLKDLPPLWEHQKTAVEMAKKVHDLALFFEQGTGKSRTAIDIIRWLSTENKQLIKTIVFCPPIVCLNWRSEILKYSNIKPEQVVVLTGHNKDRLKTLVKNFNEPRIFITNYEALLMADLFTTLKKYQAEVIVNDECHKLRDYAAKRSKLAYELCNPKTGLRPRVYMLSGTPVLNSPLDLFQPFKIMDNGKTFGTNYWEFRGKYFRDKNAGMPSMKKFPNWQVKPAALDEINALMKDNAIRVEKKDCLDLPPMVYKTFLVPMSVEQKFLYESMKKDFIAFINDKACVATLALTKGLRLMQIASGFLKAQDIDGNESEIAIEDNPKLEALESLLRDLTPNHKVLVWAVFKHNYRQIKEACQKVGVGYVEVHGEIPAAKKQQAVDAFTNNKDIRVFIGHPGSGGIGINLVAASYSIFYSRTFSLEHSLQAEARNYRGGSKEAGHSSVTRIDLVSEGSIEEHVVKVLQGKQDVSLKVLQDLAGQI